MNDEQFNIVLNKLNNIEKEIEHIKHMIQVDIKDNCDKMGDHIEFVESVYDRVKSPMYYVCNKISSIIYIGGEEGGRELE